MLWVHLDNNYEVYGVYAKSYDGLLGLDEFTIYSSYWDAIIDTIKKDLKFTNKIVEYIDKERFLNSFE